MKLFSSILAAACLMAGGSMMMAADPVPNPAIPGEKNISPSDKAGIKEMALPELPAGITAKDLNASKSIESSLANIAEDGLKKNGFDNVIGYLVDQDRARIKEKMKDVKVDDINALAEKINGALKTKYGKDFKVEAASLQSTYKFQTGEVTNTDALLGKWPVDAAVRPLSEVNQGKVTPEDVKEAKKMFGGDVNLEKGRNVALVTIPMGHGRRAITASMISEATAWRLDIPNNVDAETLHRQLVNGLTTLSNQNTWPDDYADAQRLVTHVIVGSIYGVDMVPSSDLLKTAGEK